MKMAGIYARVSTDRQEKEETIESQVDLLRRYAREHECLVPPEHEYLDTFTGSRLDRPGLERLRDDVFEGKLETLLVYCPDRLARQFAHQVILLEEFQRKGLEVVFLNRPYSDRPEDQMLLQMQGVFAEFERKMIAERMRRGRIHAARQGRVACGERPYGYAQIKKAEGGRGGELRVIESEAEVVRRIFHWFVEEGLSLCPLSRRLLEYGIPSPKGKPSWGLSVLNRLLRNPVYKGLRYYGVMRMFYKEASAPRGDRGFKDLYRPCLGRAKRDPKEWIPVPAPAIVDEALWETAQNRLDENLRFARRNMKVRTYLLKGLLVCGVCGHRLFGTSFRRHEGQPSRYKCSGQHPSHQPNRRERLSVPADEVETIVWESVRRLLSSPEVILRQYVRLERPSGDETVVAREHRRLEARSRALAHEEERLIDAYQGGGIELANLKDRRSRIRQQVKLVADRLKQIEDEITDRKKQLRVVQGIQSFCQETEKLLENPSLEQKMKIMRLVLDRVIVKDRQLTLRHIIPLGDDKLLPANRSSHHHRRS